MVVAKGGIVTLAFRPAPAAFPEVTVVAGRLAGRLHATGPARHRSARSLA